MKRPIEFYKDLEDLKKQALKLLLVFGNKDYQKIKELSENIQAYISENAEAIKKLGFSNFKILLDNYGLYNIDGLVKRSSPEFLIELSKKPDLIKDADQMMIDRLFTSEIINLEDAPRIKVMFSDYFESKLYKDNPKIVEKIFLGSKLYTEDFMELFLSRLDISKIPANLFDEDIQTLLKNVNLEELYKILKAFPIDKGKEFFLLKFSKEKILKVLNGLSLDQLNEILTCLNEKQIYDYFNYYDENLDYKLNAWKCSEKNEYRDVFNTRSAVLQLMGIKSDASLMVKSPLYKGTPINLSDYVTEDQYNENISLYFQKLMTFNGYKGLYDYFTEEEIKIIIDSLMKNSKESVNNSQYFTDKNSGFDLLEMINSQNYDEVRSIFIKGKKKGLAVNGHIYKEWLSVLTEEEKQNEDLMGYINYFSQIFPFTKAREILDKFNAFKLLNRQICEMDNMAYHSGLEESLLGAMIIFDAFSNSDNINKILEVYKEIGFTKFKILFNGITERLSPNFLNDIKNNYKEISQKSGYLADDHSYYGFLNPKYNSFLEMINDYENYNNIHNYVSAAIYKIKRTGKVSEEYCRYYSDMFEKAVARQGLAIPYVTGSSVYYSFDSLRLWDGRLASFDIESGASISKDAKDKLFTDNNCRLVEVKDKNGEIIDQIYIQIDEDNNVSLSSLIGLNNETIKQQIYNEIIGSLDKGFKAQGITVKYNVSNGIQELSPNISTPNLFVEPVKKITILKGDRLEDRPEYNDDRLKFSSIERMAFMVGEGHLFEDGLYTKGDSTTFYIGRDWILKTAQNTLGHFDFSTNQFINDPRPNTYIDFMARHSAGEENIGQKEMYGFLEDLIYNSEDLIYTGSHPTSYYGFAKMAAQGKMFITSDHQNVMTGEGFFTSCDTIRIITDENNDYDYNNIRYSFTSGYGPGREKDAGKIANDMEFISPRNLNLAQQQKMIKQQSYYAELVKYLEEERKKEKTPDENYKYALTSETEEEIYKQLEAELPEVKNLRGFSIGYLKEILRRRGAGQYVLYTTDEKPYYNI